MALEPQLAGDTTCALRAPFAAHTLQALLAPGDPGLALAATTLAAAALVLLQAHRLLLDPPLGCLRTFPLLLFSFASVTALSPSHKPPRRPPLPPSQVGSHSKGNKHPMPMHMAERKDETKGKWRRAGPMNEYPAQALSLNSVSQVPSVCTNKRKRSTTKRGSLQEKS